jgi:acetyl-CoA carboxylase biotin carboxyl carrier protein
MTQTKKHPGVDIDSVRQLVDILTEAGLSELEYASGDCRIRVSRSPAVAPLSPQLPAGPSVATGAGKDGQPRSEADTFADHPGLLSSPMVGIVYTSSEPGAPPFVKVGDQVAAGDTVLLIEAMKVFNPIKAHRAGVLERMFVSSGMPVEYGEPLLLIA